MKLFIDSADPKEIAELAETGLVDGVTTNPSLAAKTGLDYLRITEEDLRGRPGPVSAEVLATDAKGMIAEGERFAKIAKNITIKVPLTWDGMKACRALRDAGADGQRHAMLLAGAGDDGGESGRDLHLAFHRPAWTMRRGRHGADPRHPPRSTTIMTSRRKSSPPRFAASAMCAKPRSPAPMWRRSRRRFSSSCLNHPLTDKGLAAFLADAKKANLRIREE